MIPTQTLVDYPVFGDEGTKVKPEDAKYSNGFLPGEVLPAEYQNYFLNKSSAGISTLNRGVNSMEKELNNVVTAGGGVPVEGTDNQVISAIQTLIDAAKREAILAAHPVGSLYWTSSTENPSVTFGGGTWEQIKDKFILAAGETYENGALGGAAIVTLTEEQIPSHTHTFTGSAVTSAANNRGHTHTTNSTSKTLTGSVTNIGVNYNDMSRSGIFTIAKGMGYGGTSNPEIPKTSLSIDATHTHGTASESQNHTHSVTAAGTNSNTGGSAAHNNMPPYLVQYCWRRTA